MNDLRPLFALCFCLLGHGAQHRLRQVHLLNLHIHHFDAPRGRVRIQNALQAYVDLFPVGQQFVQLSLAQH